MMTEKQRKGLRYRPHDVIGKHLFRVRETYLRDHVAPLLRSNRADAVKVDLVLRGLALSPQHLGQRRIPGFVLPHITYEDLFDLVRPADDYGRPTDPAGDLYDAEVREKKRKWVGEQLQLLQQRRLVHRVDRPGRRPHLVVLRDDGAGKLFDDPDGTTGNTYVTVLGAIIASGELVKWGTAELATYLAAMVAEWHDPTFDSAKVPAGSGRWYRPVSWFNSDRRPAHHVRIPFSEATLERGLKRLIAGGLIAKDQRLRDPATGRRFRTGRRNVYTNRFAILNEVVQAQTIGSEQFDAEMRQLVEASPAAPGVTPERSGSGGIDGVMGR